MSEVRRGGADRGGRTDLKWKLAPSESGGDLCGCRQLLSLTASELRGYMWQRRTRAMTKTHLTIVIVTLALQGCAGFQGKNIERFADSKISTSEKPKVHYKATFSANMIAGRLSEVQQEGEFIRAVRDSECCIVTTDEASSDVQIRVAIAKYENPAALIPAFITGFSLYTIPSWATTRYKFSVTGGGRDKRSFSYELEDTMTLVQWLPMMFVFPFAMPTDAEDRVVKNMHKHLLHRLHEDGVI